MNLERESDQELSVLLSAMLDGQMTAAQESRLGELLRDNSEAQEVYLDCCRTHALLRQELGGCGDISRAEGDGIGSADEMPHLLGAIDDLSLLSSGPPSSVPFPPA